MKLKLSCVALLLFTAVSAMTASADVLLISGQKACSCPATV